MKNVKEKLLNNASLRWFVILFILVIIAGVEIYQEMQVSSELVDTTWRLLTNSENILEFKEDKVFVNGQNCSGTYELLKNGNLKMSFDQDTDIVGFSKEISGICKFEEDKMIVSTDTQKFIFCRYHDKDNEQSTKSEKVSVNLEEVKRMISEKLITQSGDEEIEISQMNIAIFFDEQIIDAVNIQFINKETNEIAEGKLSKQGKFYVKWTKIEDNQTQSGIVWRDMFDILDAIKDNRQMQEVSMYAYVEEIIPKAEFVKEPAGYFSYEGKKLVELENVGDLPEFDYAIQVTGYQYNIEDGSGEDKVWYVLYKK